MSLKSIWNIILHGTESLTMRGSSVEIPQFDNSPLPQLQGVDSLRREVFGSSDPRQFRVRTPQEIMRRAWENVGKHLYQAIDDVGCKA
jgi:hypothetical protein